MSSSAFVGNSAPGGPGFCPAPPPPPPPPPVPGQVPALRINTVEAPGPRRPLPNNNNPYEPPAAIQNAMMTKDKKPFTYTPGMGGKLDLSQIRSPRMARRVAKNANDEGIEGPPKSSLAAEPRPVSAAPNLYVQPQVAVPVFPTNAPPQPSVNRSPSAPASRVPSNASDRAVEVQRPVTRVEMKPSTQVSVSPQATPPETPTTPPQVTLAKAPTPWLQNKNKPQEELPEWAKRASVNRPASSTSPESPNSHTAQIQINQTPQSPQVHHTIQLQQPPQSRQQQQPPPPPRQQSLPQERVIPLRIEDRPSVFSVKHEPGHHQFKQQPQASPHHQQRWGNSTSPPTPVQAQSPQFPIQNQQQQPQSSGGGTYIVPIMVEGSSSNNSNNGPATMVYSPPQQVQARSQPVQNQSPRVIVQRGPPSPQIQQQGEPGPLQSRSFRVLQKITDTDVPDDANGEQIRKLQLTEDDKVLMNKFKEQVDGDGTYLHQEEDPRYRGAAIPSRAFRFLQNMTDSGDVTTNANGPRAPSAINKRQNRNSRTFEESQANLPASEQQAPEPKKYTGSAIPSRSFRILQAMTAPESIAKQENRQAVVTCRTESSMQPVNQQQTLFLSAPSSYDSPSEPPLAPSQSQQLQSQPQQSQAYSPQPQQLQPLPPPFWQFPEAGCWWGSYLHYPIHYPPMAQAPPAPSSSSSSSQPSSSSSPSSSSLSSALQLLPTTANNPHNISSYESYAYCPGCHHPHHHHHHHHHHLQDRNAFAYYHPFYDQRLFAAAISSPNGISSSSSTSYSSFSPDTSAVRQCSTDLSSSSVNEEPMAVVSSSELLASSSSTLSSSVSSHLARPTILHPASSSSATCFAPAFLHHQPTSESPGYDSNCNPCLERTAAAGPTTIFRCPPPIFAPGSASPGDGFPCCGGRNSWVCQDPALGEPGPPPWRLNCHQNTKLADSQREEIVDQEEKSAAGWNLDGSIGNNEVSGGRQREETSNRKEDCPEVSGKCGFMDSSENVEASKPKWSWNQLEGKEDTTERSGRNIDSHLAEENVRTENSRWKTINTVPTKTEQTNPIERPWLKKNIKEKEDDAERSGRNIASNLANRLETLPRKWTKNHVQAKGDDAEKSRSQIKVTPVYQEEKIDEPRWNRIDSASRNLNEPDASIPMNILHEERNVNDSSLLIKSNINEASASLINEDRYSEDGNDSEVDSETDSTSTDSSVNGEPVDQQTDSDTDSESDSDDSDSYLAYSTGLNPHNALTKRSNSSVTTNYPEKEFRKSLTATTIDEDVFDERSCAMSSDRLNSTDCESCVEEDDAADEEMRNEAAEKTNTDHSQPEEIVPHRLSVIHEDEQSKIGSDGWQDVADEAATVSVSLPLRFRFSVTDNDQDVTVIVGDSTVKTAEASRNRESNDVSIKLNINEEIVPTVDFTLRKSVSREANPDDIDFWANETATESNDQDENSNRKVDREIEERSMEKIGKEEEENNDTCNEDECIDFWETLKSGNESPDFNFNSRNARNRLEISSPPQVSKEEIVESDSRKSEEKLEQETVITEENKNSFENKEDDEEEEEEAEDEEEGEDDEEDEDEEDGEENTENMETKNSKETREEISSKSSAPLLELTEAKAEDNENEEETTKANTSKHLLSVQNSRDETDDEDSGVTSDMSRLISEVDTDSECGPARKVNGYKRTQTHSRLFRLLSRDDDVNEETTNTSASGRSARRDRLSLPLKNAGFSYDESHLCSNYSSGLTSPDYSPVYEGSWRRIYSEENVQPATPENSRSPGSTNEEEMPKNRRDPYFDTWKKSVAEETTHEQKRVSSLIPAKMLGNPGGALPGWRFRTNVLCPRIKSTKNVPRVMRQNRPAKPVVVSGGGSKAAGNEKC